MAKCRLRPLTARVCVGKEVKSVLQIDTFEAVADNGNFSGQETVAWNQADIREREPRRPSSRIPLFWFDRGVAAGRARWRNDRHRVR
jgi:hypothetical protein